MPISSIEQLAGVVKIIDDKEEDELGRILLVLQQLQLANAGYVPDALCRQLEPPLELVDSIGSRDDSLDDVGATCIHSLSISLGRWSYSARDHAELLEYAKAIHKVPALGKLSIGDADDRHRSDIADSLAGRSDAAEGPLMSALGARAHYDLIAIAEQLVDSHGKIGKRSTERYHFLPKWFDADFPTCLASAYDIVVHEVRRDELIHQGKIPTDQHFFDHAADQSFVCFCCHEKPPFVFTS
jgi:hypothetical protein